MTKDNFGTWLEIDLGTLQQNFKILSDYAKKPVMPIVKANGYGHGLEKVAACLEKAGAEWLGVARIEEAMLLREYGVKARILVLGYTSSARVSHAIKEKISLTAYDFEVAEEYALKASDLHEKLTLHAKIDTGMGRLGIPINQAEEFIQFLLSKPSLDLEGIFTHFARADEPREKDTYNQLAKFTDLISKVKIISNKPFILHTANSAGMLAFPKSRFDMVRVGIALYGLPPSHQVKLPKGVKPVLSWKTRLISIKDFPVGHGLSYGFKYYTKKKERIGVIAVGYGDGFRRKTGNKVLIRGKYAPVIGSVCMDQSLVQLDEISMVQIGDEVVIIGNQGEQVITATDIADNWGTINYEVVCGLASRMPRYYVK